MKKMKFLSMAGLCFLSLFTSCDKLDDFIGRGAQDKELKGLRKSY